MHFLSPAVWTMYELIDSGGFEKLERFGKYILIRPEPQAVWDKGLSDEEWEKRCHARFHFEKSNPDKGKWVLKAGMPEQWFIVYQKENLHIRLRLGLTAFRHIGIFPEQAPNWDYIFVTLNRMKCQKPRVLNLFAYTGAASLAACAAGAEVVHVDSVKPVISWARENMEASGMENIRWVVEDAMKFVRREVRRGAIYQGILLDPPAYGRGPDGEKWLLEQHINEMTGLCSQLLDKTNGFILFNLYSMGFSSIILDNLVSSHFGQMKEKEYGELIIPDSSGKMLPLGIFFRGTI